MNNLLNRLPLAVKLILLALVPLLFVIYLAVQFYNEKGQKFRLFKSFKDRISISADLAGLIGGLQEERKFSFDYAMTSKPREELFAQRPQTDYYIKRLEGSNNPGLLQFASYTNLNKLNEIRSQIDTAKIAPDVVMHYYSNMIFRLNTLNTIPVSVNIFQESLYKELATQKIISEMITYLGIIRSNIYNVLYTKKFMVETLIGTIGTYDVYNSYEKELLVKASPSVVDSYRRLKANTALKATTGYIDTLFNRFKFDNTYSSQQWWIISDKGTEELRKLQRKTWQNINTGLNEIQEKEQVAQNRTLIFLLLTFLIVVSIAAYTVYSISRTLGDLRNAARKIAKGVTLLNIESSTQDVIGDLASCISSIDKNNFKLAEAAAAMGKGNFDVVVEPRSKDDILGNAIVKMKTELRRYKDKMEMLVADQTKELQRSNEDLQQFAHVASHDLKEPVRKVMTFANRLKHEFGSELPEKASVYLSKVESSAIRMYSMIDGVLLYSTLNAVEQTKEGIDMKEMLQSIESDLEVVISQKEATIKSGEMPMIEGSNILIYQLFYNLINNAFKFSSSDRKPVVLINAVSATNEEVGGRNLDTAKGYVKITVRDNGIGFANKEAEKIFGTFTRLHSKEVYEGTGLGLSLCKKIVERHGGAIYAEGEEGRGAIFTILLPR